MSTLKRLTNVGRGRPPYSAIQRAAIRYADNVMNRATLLTMAEQRIAWNVAFNAYKCGARWNFNRRTHEKERA